MVATPGDLSFSDVEPGRIAAAISDLLVQHGYPPTAAWQRDEYRQVWNVIRAAYAVSEDAAKRLANDSTHAAIIERRIAELEQRYAS